MCGEKPSSTAINVLMRGSPPRVRGKVTISDTAEQKQRITPAFAGKSILPKASRRICRDHPRVCGEKRQIWYKMLCCGGSPPRVRGKVLLHRHSHDKLGITPACAGKSFHQRNLRLVDGDHPRVCGEKPSPINGQRYARGSPPRVRGKVYPVYS